MPNAKYTDKALHPPDKMCRNRGQNHDRPRILPKTSPKTRKIYCTRERITQCLRRKMGKMDTMDGQMNKQPKTGKKVTTYKQDIYIQADKYKN